MGAEQSGLLANLTAQATVLSPDRSRSAAFDREGRLLYFFRAGKTFKRSLGSEVHLRFKAGRRQRRQLSIVEARAVFEEVYQLATAVARSARGDVKRRLEEEILRWTPALLLAESDRFRATYRPIAILPPDQYLAVVLQATEGCTWNGCTFCNFYMNRPFRAKSAAEFARHCEAVHELLGAGLRLRRGIFLADGNALALSRRRLEPLLRIAREMFPGRGLYGFVDLYSGERRRFEDWGELREMGLARIYVGMETGLDELLRFVNKPGSAAELTRFVQLLKQAGLQVSLIVMVGLGGQQYRQRHRRATAELLLGLPLDAKDLVYLAPFVEHSDSVYRQRRIAAGLEAMSEGEIESETARLGERLRAHGLKVSRYDIREFIY